MPSPITIPRLGWNMDEGTFVGWLKQDGDSIRPGDPLFTLEGEKATEDVEALDAGTLRIAPEAPRPGTKLPVGAVIGYLVQPGEAITREGEAPAELARPEPRPPGGSHAFPARSVAAHRGSPAVSPRARRVAAELGVDWTRLQGSGKTGRIRERDVRAAVQAQPTSAPEVEAVPVTAVRRTIAERMLASARSTAPVTLTTTADASNLVNLRRQFQAAQEGDVPSYTDFLAKLAALALRGHPLLNARWDGEQIILCKSINIGIAVDMDSGLMVPVLRDVPGLGLRQLAFQARDLAERARRRALKAHELEGGTFTLTNLGSYGIDAFTPILNYPQSAILGVGRIRRQPAVVGNEVVAREQLTLNLTFDHRVVDGAPAARFLQALVRLVENPGPALLA